MKKQYDFSKGERGTFYRRDIELRIPVYLEPESAAFLRKIAGEKGTDVQQVVNDLIRGDIDRIKSLGCGRRRVANRPSASSSWRW